MPLFKRYIGIDYSGAQTPTTSLKGLRVYLVERGVSQCDFLGETWALSQAIRRKSLMQMVGAVGIEPTTSPVWKRKNYARFRQLFSVLVSRSVLIRQAVLACFDP
jgi:hypothetical protein